LDVNGDKFSLVSSGLGLEDKFVLSVESGFRRVLVLSGGQIELSRPLVGVKGVDRELSLEDIRVDGDKRLFSSRNQRLGLVDLLSLNSQL